MSQWRKRLKDNRKKSAQRRQAQKVRWLKVCKTLRDQGRLDLLDRAA